MTGVRVRCSAEDHDNVLPLDKKHHQHNLLLASNKYEKLHLPGGLCLSSVLLLHNRCAHGGYRTEPLLFQKQDSQSVQETKHEWVLANETPQLHDQEFYVSWLHWAWKGKHCQEQSPQRQHLCKLSFGQPMLAT
jgi:hypothetical protein